MSDRVFQGGLFTIIIFWLLVITERISKMSQLDTDIQAVSDAEVALEARVTAHEQHDAEVAADLQAQIDSLKKNGTTPENLKALEDLKTRIDNFDPAAP